MLHGVVSLVRVCGAFYYALIYSVDILSTVLLKVTLSFNVKFKGIVEAKCIQYTFAGKKGVQMLRRFVNRGSHPVAGPWLTQAEPAGS